MATTFTRIDDLLGGRKSDVLNQPAGGMAGQPQSSPESPGFKAPVGGTSSGFAGGAAAPVKSSEIATGQANNAYLNDANKQAVKSNIIDKNVNTIKSATEAQKASAKQYVDTTSQAADAYAVDDKTIDSGISGDQDAYSKLGGTLGANLKIDDWKANDNSGVDVSNFTDPAKINTMESQAANQSSGGQYTLGMSKLDAALRGAANLDYNKVFKEQDAFNAAGAEGKAAAEAVKTGEAKQLDDIKSLLKGKLGGKQTGIKDVLAQRKQQSVEADNARLRNEYNDMVNAQKASGSVLLNQIRNTENSGRVSQAELNAIQAMTNRGVPLTQGQQETAARNYQLAQERGYAEKIMQDIASGKYVKQNFVDPNQIDPNTIANEQEALQFNNINRLLGLGGNISSGQFKGGSSTNEQAKAQAQLQNYLNRIKAISQRQREGAYAVQDIGDGRTVVDDL